MTRKDEDYWLVGKILDKIYKSEIHLSIGWMWDGGIDYKIGSDLEYLDGDVISTGCDEMCEALPEIANEVMKRYPNSDFALWWRDVGFPHHQ